MKRYFFIALFLLIVLGIVFFNAGSSMNIKWFSAAVTTPEGNDRIHEIFTKSNSLATSSDSILIESNGQYGLIDTGNPSGDSGKYAEYDYPAFDGNVVANYLSKNGVKRLAFVILTHGHSDHVGGLPVLASKGYIDSNTVIIYRKLNTNRSDEAQYYTSYYYNKAIDSVKNKAKMLEISDTSSTNLKKINATYKNTSKAATKNITFTFGDFNIKLFNIGTYGPSIPENQKSIVTYITNGSYKALLLSESSNHSNVNNDIADYVGKVDFLKTGHYQNIGTISVHMLNVLNPTKVILQGNFASNTTVKNDDALALAYFNETKAMVIGNEDAGYPLVASFDNAGINMYYNNNGNYTKISTYNRKTQPQEGWFKVIDKAPYTTENLVWIHINSDHKLSKGFITYNGDNYFLVKVYSPNSSASPGVMLKNWQFIDEKWYYINPTKTSSAPEGKIMTSWLLHNGKTYYLDPNSNPAGQMVTGYKVIGNDLYYFLTADEGTEGQMLVNGTKDGTYFGPDGKATNYSGKAIKPTASNYCKAVVYNGKAQFITKSAGDGYYFLGNKKTNAGTYTVTAILEDGYSWSDASTSDVTFSCSISKVSIGDASVSSIPDQQYTGSAIKPTPYITITLSGTARSLVNNTDYTLSYTNNTKVGTATLKISGKGNYAGSKSVTFKIIDEDLSFINTTNMKIKDNKVYLMIATGTSINKNTLFNNINNNSNKKLYKKDNTEVTSSSEVIGTGYSLKTTAKTYPIVVFGDVDGSGTINANDMAIVYKKIRGTINLTGLNFEAADIDETGSVNANDLRNIYIKIKR